MFILFYILTINLQTQKDPEGLGGEGGGRGERDGEHM